MSHMPPAEPVTATRMGLEPHRGAMILVFGILSFFICFIFGIVAWSMGNADLRAMDEGRMDPEGRGLTQAGKIIGMISVILAIVGLVLSILWMVIVFVFIGAAGVAGAAGG